MGPWSILVRLALVLSVATGLACAGEEGPSRPERIGVVVEQRFAPPTLAIHRLAVAPLLLGESVEATGEPDMPALGDEVSDVLAETLADSTISIIGPDKVRKFAPEGGPKSARDVEALARVVNRRFGATGLVLGRLHRYREREGSAADASAGASVGLEMRVYSAPGARLLWLGRFDHTQTALGPAPEGAAPLPDGGQRWLSAAELAGWGAGNLVALLITPP